MKDNKLKIQIFLDKRKNGIVQPDGTYGTQNVNDYYVNVNLTREINIIDEYISIDMDPFKRSMEKQKINPWFYEFGFFESIKSTGISGKTDNYITTSDLEDVNKKAKIFSININK